MTPLTVRSPAEDANILEKGQYDMLTIRYACIRDGVAPCPGYSYTCGLTSIFSCRAPRLTGLILRLFVWIAESWYVSEGTPFMTSIDTVS